MSAHGYQDRKFLRHVVPCPQADQAVFTGEVVQRLTRMFIAGRGVNITRGIERSIEYENPYGNIFDCTGFWYSVLWRQ